jgi:hypothetical protein
MKLKLQININDFHVFNMNENQKDDVKKVQNAILTSLKRAKKDIWIILENLNIIVEKCRICKKEYPPIQLKFNIENDIVNIIGFEYKNKIYCYGKNKECYGRKLNANSWEFLSLVFNLNKEEALEYLHKRNKSPFYKENHKDLKEYSKSQSRGMKFFIKLYGKEEGLIKWNIKKERHKFVQTQQYYIDTYGEQGLILWEENNKKKAITIENLISKYKDIDIAEIKYESWKRDCIQTKHNFIKRHGKKKGGFLWKLHILKLQIPRLEKYITKYGKEEGTRKYNILIKILRYKNSEQYYINIYGEIEGKQKWEERKRKCAVTLFHFIKKHGKIKGYKRWLKWKTITNLLFCRASKESLKVFSPLIEYCKITHNLINNDFRLGIDNNTEFNIYDTTNKKNYYFDFTIPKYNIIIEYHGIAWHINPDNHTIEEISNWKTVKGLSGIDVVNHQNNKKNIAIQNNFYFLEIWSDNSLENNINICKQFIDNIIKNKK